MAKNAHKKRKRREQEIWADQSQQSKTWEAADEMIYERSFTLTGEDIVRWSELELFDWDETVLIALSDAEFARWRASVHESSAAASAKSRRFAVGRNNACAQSRQR